MSTTSARTSLSRWLLVALLASSSAWFGMDYVSWPGATFLGIASLLVGLALWLSTAAPGERRGAAGFVGLSLVTVLAVDEALAWLEAAYQPLLVPFSWALRSVMSLAGVSVTTEGREALAQTSEGLFAFQPTLGLIGFRTLAAFWIGALLVLSISAGGIQRRTLAWLAGVPLTVFSLRYAVEAANYVGTDDILSVQDHLGIANFWNPWTLQLAAVLSAFLLHELVPLRGPLTMAMPGGVRALYLGLGSACLAGALWWVDPGRPGQGRILIDDRLSGLWEPAGRLLTEDRFGDFSTYSFSVLTEHLSRRFAVTVNAQRSYDRELLDGYDVLVIKTPHQPLETEEVAAIHAWMAAGGGLFAIGDHTDLGGMNTTLNAVTAPLGVRFRFDSVGTTDGGYNAWSEPRVSQHPIAHGLGATSFMTGCSLDLDWARGSRPVLLLDHASSAEGDYSKESNFGALAPHPGSPQGRSIAAAACEVGAGRLVAFADSTVLSSFSYYQDQHADFVLRAISWLDAGASHGGILRGAWCLLGVVGLVLGSRRVGLSAQPALLALVSLGSFAGLWSAAWIGGELLPTPRVRTAAPVVGFVTEGGFAWLPPVLGSTPGVPEEGNFATLFQVPQRLGLETRVVPREPDALRGLGSLWILNPEAEAAPTSEWLEAVHAWVSAGGALVVAQRRGHGGHGSPDYLGGLSWQHVDLPVQGLHVDRSTLGKGKVFRIEGSELLNVDGLGHCMSYPGARQRELFDVLYTLLGELGGEPLDRRTYVRLLPRG